MHNSVDDNSAVLKAEAQADRESVQGAPYVSIVVPAYNAEKHITETLDSVLAQTLTTWECIVVDDGSTDATADRVKAFTAQDERFRYIRQENQGVSATRNAGLLASSPAAPLVIFLDNDDVLVPTALQTLSADLNSDDAAVGVSGLCEYIDAAGNPHEPGRAAEHGRTRYGYSEGRKYLLPHSAALDFSVIVLHNVILSPGQVLLRKRFVQSCDGFDVEMRYAEDWDLWIRLARRGPIRFVNQVVLLYREHSNNATKSIPNLSWKRWLARSKAFWSPENTKDQRRIAQLALRDYIRKTIRRYADDMRNNLSARRVGAAIRTAAEIAFLSVFYIVGFPLPIVRSPRGSALPGV